MAPTLRTTISVVDIRECCMTFAQSRPWEGGGEDVTGRKQIDEEWMDWAVEPAQ